MSLPQPSDSTGFTRAVLRSSVAQMCLAAGVDVAEGSAYEGLVEVCERRIMELANKAKAAAEITGSDVVTLDDIQTAFGLCDPKVDVTKLKAVSEQWVTSFTKPLMDYPIVDDTFVRSASIAVEESEPRPAGPQFPPLPPPHTYQRNRLLESNAADKVDEREMKRARADRRIMVRESLAKLREDVEQHNTSVAVAAASDVVQIIDTSPLAPVRVGDFDRAIEIAAPSTTADVAFV